ncbi:MAG TPA: histidine kinase [Bacteroidales bacterium]|nr:histidine kinase [Bacteroidales bacterium]
MLKAFYSRHKYFLNMLAVLGLLVIVRTLDWLAWSAPAPDKVKTVLVEHLIEFICFLPILILIIYSFRWALKKNNKLILYSIIILFILFGPIIFLCLTTWLSMLIWDGYVVPISFDFFAKYAPGASLIVLFVSSAFYITHLVEQSGKQKETAHKAETLAKDVQLKMLRYQINPHFLFNVLSSIYTLIDENAEKAKKLVIDMSEYYRYTLSKQQQTISIEREIDSIMKYLEIQKARFEEEFQYDIYLDEAVKQVPIPTFLIHLLVENSVKYGTKTEKHKLIIRLSVRLSGKNLIISVSNSGKLLPSSSEIERNVDGTGNGIENLKKRLSLYYNDNYSFSLREEDGSVIATIEVYNVNIR